MPNNHAFSAVLFDNQLIRNFASLLNFREILEIENIISVFKNATDCQLLLLSLTKTNKNEEAKLSDSTPDFNSIYLLKK